MAAALLTLRQKENRARAAPLHGFQKRTGKRDYSGFFSGAGAGVVPSGAGVVALGAGAAGAGAGVVESGVAVGVVGAGAGVVAVSGAAGGVVGAGVVSTAGVVVVVVVVAGVDSVVVTGSLVSVTTGVSDFCSQAVQRPAARMAAM
jgi:hypothetical protein